MFALQKYLAENAQNIGQLIQKYAEPSSSAHEADAAPQRLNTPAGGGANHTEAPAETWPQTLQRLENEARHFTIRVPLIGKFSSGKSTLLNTVLGERTLAASVDPQTALPAEITWAEGPARFAACLPDGRERPLAAQQVRDNALDFLDGSAWVRIQHPAAALKRWPHLCLVDLPGLDSSIERHSRAIDQYASRSLAYCAVVSAEEGTLHESMLKALQELRLTAPHLPVIAVITKCDKRSEADVQAVAATVTQAVTQALGRAPQATVCVRRGQAQPFLEALDALEQQAEAIFNHAIGQPLDELLAQAGKRLDTLANRDDIDSQQIQADIERLKKERHAIEQNIAQRTQALESDLPAIESNILQTVRNALQNCADSHISAVLGGRDISSDIHHTVRAALQQGVRQDFAPELQSYLLHLNESIPKDLDIRISALNLHDGNVDTKADDSTQMATVISFLLGAIPKLLPKLAGHIGILVAAIPLVVHLLNRPTEADRAEQREARREEARDQLKKTYAEVISRVGESLFAYLQKQVQEAKKQIAASVHHQIEQQTATLRQLEQRLSLGQEQFAALQAQTRGDLARLRQWQADVRRIARLPQQPSA